jgi:hypothetical protein
MTAVLFKFSHPDGTPVADAPFLITTRKPSFDETLHNGIQIPGDVNGVTDAQGEATLELMAGFATYYLLMDKPGATLGENGCTAGLRYRFMVTDSATVVRVEDLIITTPTFSRPWDETALQIIIDAKTVAVGAAIAAEAARDVALAQTGIIDGIAEETRIAAAEALASRDQAEGFAVAAGASSESTAADVLLTHQDVVLTHADVITVAADKTATGAFATAAQASAVASEASAVRSEAAAGHSDTVLAQATAAKDTAVTKAAEATAGAASVASDKTIVLAAKDVTLAARDQAVEAAQTVVGALVEAGGIDLSAGVYPAKPSRATIWKVTVGGVVTGTHGDTYGVGDSLVYSKQFDYFYKIDNTESVSSVAGKTGVVTLDKVDVGLGNVDNTSDLNKPMSTAALAFNTAQDAATTAGLLLKIDKTSIVDALTSTDPTKVLSAKQGKALYDLLQANNVTLVVFEYLATAGQTVFSGVDINGLTLLYTPGTGTIVMRNGVIIERTVDYVATSGSSVTVGQACDVNDLIQVMAFGTFSVANMYTKPEADALLLTKASKSDTDTKFVDRYTKAEDAVQISTAIAALSLKTASKADIIGPVSQTAGVPTGAIIETGGTLATGFYTKYADGSMDVTRRVTASVAIATTYGSLFYNSVAALTFPIPFVGNLPIVNLQACAGTVGAIWIGRPNLPTLGDTGIFMVIAPGSLTAANITFDLIAKGRWF